MSALTGLVIVVVVMFVIMAITIHRLLKRVETTESLLSLSGEMHSGTKDLFENLNERVNALTTESARNKATAEMLVHRLDKANEH